MAAVSGCGAASTAPVGPVPMPEYPPLDRPPANAGAARTSAPATLVAKAAANGEGEGDGERDEALTDWVRGHPAKATVARPRHPKNCCKGTNECKGKGYCKTANNACKGINDCKGQGGCKPTVCP